MMLSAILTPPFDVRPCATEPEALATRDQISFSDVRALLRLCNRLHELGPEPTPQREHMLGGVRALTGADEAWAWVAAIDADAADAPPATVSFFHVSRDDSAPPTVSPVSVPVDAPWAAFRRRLRRETLAGATADPSDGDGRRLGIVLAQGDAHRAGHRLHSFLPLSSSVTGGSVVVAAGLTICRAPGRHHFTRRERSILCALHAEVAWVYRAEVMLASPDTRRLSPRQQQTLGHLLAGLAEKQIAAEMNLSPNTIHHYVKALHKHFGVSSRSELLARWVGK